MKKIIFSILLAIIVLGFFGKQVYGWSDCPYGKINDPFPGSCFRYLDTNNNQICDHSEPQPQKSTSAATISAINQKQNNTIFWIMFLTASGYFCHWYLVFKTQFPKKYKWLNQVGFRFFWNLVLLITFLITGISGLILAFGVLNKTFSLWHNYAGLVFVIVGFFHFLNHLQYFKKPA